MQVLVHRTRHKADRLVTGALQLLSLACCMCLSCLSGCKGEESACNLTPRVAPRVMIASLRGKGIMYIDACKTQPASHIRVVCAWLNYQTQGERSGIHASYD